MQEACQRKVILPLILPIGKESSDKMSILSDLPEELIKEIFSFLSSSDLIRARLVCRRWEAISKEKSLIFPFFKRNYPWLVSVYRVEKLTWNLYGKASLAKNKVNDPAFESSFSVLGKHRTTVTSLSFWDGLLYSSSLDRTIRLWDLNEGKEFDKKVSNYPIQSFALSPGGEAIYAFSTRLLQVFGKKDSKPIHEVAIDMKKVLSFQVESEKLYVTEQKGIKEFDLEFKSFRFFEVPDALRFHIFQGQIFYYDIYGTVHILDQRSQNYIAKIPTSGFSTCLTCGEEGLYIGQIDGTLKIIDYRKREVIRDEFITGCLGVLTSLKIVDETLLGEKRYNLSIWERTSMTLKKVLHVDSELVIHASQNAVDSIYLGMDEGTLFKYNFS